MAVGRTSVDFENRGSTETYEPLSTRKYLCDNSSLIWRWNMWWPLGGPSPSSSSEPVSKFEDGSAGRHPIYLMFFVSKGASTFFSETGVSFVCKICRIVCPIRWWFHKACLSRWLAAAMIDWFGWTKLRLQ